MTYIMQQDLRDYINAQRAEAEAYSQQPGCWMGKMVDADDIEYWSERVPSGTLRELKRTELIEDAYYITADHVSKSYARSLQFHRWTDDKILRHIEKISKQAERERQIDHLEKVAEEARLDNLAADMGVCRETLDRWIEEGYPSEVFQPRSHQPDYAVY